MDEFIKWFSGNWWTFWDALITIFTLILVFVNWYNNFINNREITIYLLHKAELIKLPIKILRKNLTRAELFGILGAFEKDSKFSISYTSTIEFFEDLEKIQNSKKNELTIIITENDKFDRVNI